MIYCQVCQTPNAEEQENCRKCGAKLLVIGMNKNWDESPRPRLSIEDHLLERISGLEEMVRGMLDHLSRLSESLEVVDRNSFVSRAGLSSLVDVLKETKLLREEILYERWEATLNEQMEQNQLRDRFTQMKGRFFALYRGKQGSLSRFRSLIEEAEFQLFADRVSEGIETLMRAVRLDERNYELIHFLAEYQNQQGNEDLAISMLHLALIAKDDHFGSLLLLGLIYYGQEKHERAKELLKRCLEQHPTHPVALLCFASILIAEGNYDPARIMLETANESEPRAEAHYLLGVIAKSQNHSKEAIDQLTKAIELEPDHEEALFMLGTVCLERGWTKKAKVYLTRALELNPGKIEYREAVENSDQTPDNLNLDVDDLEQMRFADALVREGKPKQALPRYRALVKRHPENLNLLTSFALLVYSMGRYEETLRHAIKLRGLASSNFHLCVASALAMESLRVLGRYEEAYELLTEMMKQFPSGLGRAIAQYGMAMTKADLGQDLAMAEALAREALANSPPEFRHHVLDALGWVYFKQGRYEEAQALLENALALSEALTHLQHYGMILLALNLQDQASKVFKRAYALRSRQLTVDDFILSAIQSGKFEETS